LHVRCFIARSRAEDEAETMLLAALALAYAAAVADEEIVVRGNRWAPFISPMGEPFRPSNPTDKPLATWFYQADRDRDGALTAAEMSQDAQRFFDILDADRNGSVEPTEMISYEWELAPDVQLSSRARPKPGDAPRKAEVGRSANPKRQRIVEQGLQGAARYGLLNMPQPVAAADSDFDRAVTLAEFQSAAAARFALLDEQRSGELTLPKLQRLLFAAQQQKKKPKRGGQTDSRVAKPVPVE
jgi:hypothetical protein